MKKAENTTLQSLVAHDATRESAELKLLQNSGVFVLNKSPTSSPEKTVLVLGLARGGTTMVASVLQALGVFMGEKLGPVLEDVALSEAVESRNTFQLKQIIAKRDAIHPVWGWKRPSSIEFSKVWEGNFRNPYVIAIFRDPFAIANRNRISMLSDIFQNMEHSVHQLSLFVKLLRQQKCPVLLCSYEKVLAFPEAFVQSVDEFIGLNAYASWPEAICRINPASKEYLESSRITNSLGRLDVVNKNLCSGWAFYPKRPEKQARVHIFVNDQLVHTVIAQQQRPDVKEKGIHPTGLCGFRFEWPAGTKIKADDQVVARIEGDNKVLKGSSSEGSV